MKVKINKITFILNTLALTMYLGVKIYAEGAGVENVRSDKVNSAQKYKFNGEIEDETIDGPIYEMITYVSRDRHKIANSEQKMHFLRNAARIRGNVIQHLRFFCWVIEPDSTIRRELMNQWLSVLKYEKKLPTLDVVQGRIRPLLNYYPAEEIVKRMTEIKGIYKALGKVGPYEKNDMDCNFGRLTERYLRPFIDNRLPMGSVLFSNNQEDIYHAYVKSMLSKGCTMHNGHINERQYMKGGPVYDEALSIIMRSINKR